ncbi:phage tail protein [Pseudomonas chlororaphis]|uniref:phage tail protein n=1 Tax=Pseudomonas chlororaphis TaxID=587753 RepID=UPI00406C73FC
MADYYTLLTNAGIAYETACKAAGVPIKLSQISVGDGGGAVYNPAATDTALKREVWRGPLNALFQDEKNPSWLLAEVTIPPEVGGWYVREAGLWTDTGILYAIVKYPESFKPVLATSGSGKEFYIRSIFETSNASLVTLLIDDTVVKATRAWVAGYVADELAKLDAKQSVRASTTGNIVLSSAQMIDGVAVLAGDRVLVKNQTLAKDNGIYVVANELWTRAKDADNNAKVTPNLTISVEEGATQADTIWQLITDGQIVLGTTALSFQDVTAGFARLLSPAFVGSPTGPTPPRFNNSKLLATTEFVRLAQGSRSGYIDYQAASGTVPVSDAGKYIGFNRGAAQAYALPDANTLPLGTSFYLEAVGGDVSLTAPNSRFAGPAAQMVSSSYVLRNGSACEFIVMSSASVGEPGFSYRVVGGVGKALVARNGYERMPNGLIRMWGDGSAGGHANHCAFGNSIVKSTYNAFPIPFPNELFGVVATHNSAGCPSVVIVTTGETNNGFYAAGSWTTDTSIRWQAIGR